ncbi:MAG: lipase family protein [Synechococcales bacterium]|nr:lipase family protein [Synechococcales bacterium]
MLPPDIVKKVTRFDFQHETVKYHPKIALTMAKAAKLAYFPPEQVTPFMEQDWQFQTCFFMAQQETQGYIFANDQVIIVSFRGTNALQDWFTNFDIFLPTPDAFGGVHPGFQKALNLVWNMQFPNGAVGLENYLRSLQQEKVRSLWFTGHSLGAALATLATARLREKDIPVYGLYTFGSPRLGDRDFERLFNQDFKSRSFRFVYNNDTVTRVPPRAVNYSHVGAFLYLTSQNEIKTDPFFWLQFLDRMQGRADDFLKPGTDGIKDHRIDGYIDVLAKNLNQSIEL